MGTKINKAAEDNAIPKLFKVHVGYIPNGRSPPKKIDFRHLV